MGAEFVQKQAEERTKQREAELNDISAQRDALSKNVFFIGKMARDVTAEQQSTLGSGPVTGGILSGLRPTARAVNSDLSNFVSQVMSSARNIRTQREFNAFTNAIPTAADQPQVQNEKLQYLGAANDTLAQRNDFKEQLLRNNPNIDPDQADQQAVQKFPFPTPPGGWQQNPDGSPIQQGSGSATGNAAPKVQAPPVQIQQSAAVTPAQARAMPPGVNYHVIGGPVGPDGNPVVYSNPEPAAASPVPAATQPAASVAAQ
jgi:hypothetical protein